MLEYSYFRESVRTYQPKTPVAALRAVAAGFAELEELVHQGTNVKPLVEEPYDVQELQRVISREDLDLDTNLLLVRIFTRMLSDLDQERALFAAESINRVEERYAQRIEKIKKKGDPDRASCLELARLYYEVAILNEKSPSIKNFYLREAFTYVRDHIGGQKVSLDFLRLTVLILSELGLAEQAAIVLNRAQDPKETEVRFLAAQIGFRQKRYGAVYAILSELKASYNQLPARMRTAIDQWTGT